MCQQSLQQSELKPSSAKENHHKMEAINIPLLTQYAIWINTLAPGDAIKPRHQRANLLLRAMLDYAPTEDGRAYIEQQVIECAGDNYKEKLALLSEHFIHSLLTPRMCWLSAMSPRC